VTDNIVLGSDVAERRFDAVPLSQMYERMWMLHFAHATSSANASNRRSSFTKVARFPAWSVTPRLWESA
jgi:hypothetical protein